MAELSTIVIFNPTSEDFTWNYNGEPYTVKAKAEETLTKHVAFHLAKHLSDEMLAKENPKKIEKNMRPEEIRKEEIKFSQLFVYDNPKRRIALYRILKSAPRVEECIVRYPIKSFLGEMENYKAFVIKTEGKFDDGKKEEETIESLAEKVKILTDKLEGKSTEETKHKVGKKVDKPK